MHWIPAVKQAGSLAEVVFRVKIKFSKSAKFHVEFKTMKYLHIQQIHDYCCQPLRRWARETAPRLSASEPFFLDVPLRCLAQAIFKSHCWLKTGMPLQFGCRTGPSTGRSLAGFIHAENRGIFSHTSP